MKLREHLKNWKNNVEDRVGSQNQGVSDLCVNGLLFKGEKYV